MGVERVGLLLAALSSRSWKSVLWVTTVFLVLEPSMSRAEANSALGNSGAPIASGILSWIQSDSMSMMPVQVAGEMVYVYKYADGRSVLASGSIRTIQEIIAADLSASPELRANVIERIDDILFELMSHKGPLKVTKGLLYEFEEEPHHKRLMQADEQTRATYRRLSECFAASGVKHDANAWSAKFFVFNPDGSLEEWSTSGVSKPFSIDAFRIETVAKKGALKYIPRPSGGIEQPMQKTQNPTSQP